MIFGMNLSCQVPVAVSRIRTIDSRALSLGHPGKNPRAAACRWDASVKMDKNRGRREEDGLALATGRHGQSKIFKDRFRPFQNRVLEPSGPLTDHVHRHKS